MWAELTVQNSHDTVPKITLILISVWVVLSDPGRNGLLQPGWSKEVKKLKIFTTLFSFCIKKNPLKFVVVYTNFKYSVYWSKQKLCPYLNCWLNCLIKQILKPLATVLRIYFFMLITYAPTSQKSQEWRPLKDIDNESLRNTL